MNQVGPTPTWLASQKGALEGIFGATKIDFSCKLAKPLKKTMVGAWFLQYHQDKKWWAINAKLKNEARLIKRKENKTHNPPYLDHFRPTPRKRERKDSKNKNKHSKHFLSFSLYISRPTPPSLNQKSEITPK